MDSRRIPPEFWNCGPFLQIPLEFLDSNGFWQNTWRNKKYCYLLELFLADIELFELIVDGGIVDGNKIVGFQEMQKFIQKVVRVITNEFQEIVKIFLIKIIYTASDALLFRYNVASFTPKLPDLESGMARKAIATKNVLKVE